uniref:Uncharacterized protein n=1 Tax=Arion vulgaris TaxID=1028688 RepID=A0A0B7AAK0_9EUPU
MLNGQNVQSSLCSGSTPTNEDTTYNILSTLHDQTPYQRHRKHTHKKACKHLSDRKIPLSSVFVLV